MKLFKMFKRGQKGFTLVELMVVMAIMAVLATIVVPAVTGTKGPSEGTQLSGDANAIQSAAAKFNNDSALKDAAGKAPWPELAITGSGARGIYSSSVMGATFRLNDSANTIATVTAGGYSVIDFLAAAAADNSATTSSGGATSIRNTGGTLVPVSFVPDFVPKAPASLTAMASDSLHTYVWLFKAGAGTDAPTRTVQVFKWNGSQYVQQY